MTVRRMDSLFTSQTTIQHGIHQYQLRINLDDGKIKEKHELRRAGSSLSIAALQSKLSLLRASMFERSIALDPVALQLRRIGKALHDVDGIRTDLTNFVGEVVADHILDSAWRMVLSDCAKINYEGSHEERAFWTRLGKVHDLPVALAIARIERLDTSEEIPMVMCNERRDAYLVKENDKTKALSVRQGPWDVTALWMTGRRMPVAFFPIEYPKKEELGTSLRFETQPFLDQFFHWDHMWRQIGLPQMCPMIWTTPPKGLTQAELVRCGRFRFSFMVDGEMAKALCDLNPGDRVTRQIQMVGDDQRERTYMVHKIDGVDDACVVSNCVRRRQDAQALVDMRRKFAHVVDLGFMGAIQQKAHSRPWLEAPSADLVRGRLLIGFLTLYLFEAFNERFKKLAKDRKDLSLPENATEVLGIRFQRVLGRMEKGHRLSNKPTEDFSAIYRAFFPERAQELREKENFASLAHFVEERDYTEPPKGRAPLDQPIQAVLAGLSLDDFD